MILPLQKHPSCVCKNFNFNCIIFNAQPKPRSLLGTDPQRAQTARAEMDSLAQGGRISSNGDRGSVGHNTEKLIGSQNANVTPRDHPMLQTAHHQEVKKTHYPYKEPRIDQRMYQAEIPSMQGRSSTRAVTRGSSSPRTGERNWRCDV